MNEMNKMKLDIGCGNNKKEGFLGVDIFQNPQVDYVMSATNLNFDSNSIEEIYSRRCIQHIKDDKKALNEMYRVLQKDGKLTLIVASWRGWLYYKLRWVFQKKTYDCFNLYTKKKLVKMLKDAGFKHVLFDMLGTGFLKEDFFVVCIKN